uniref:orotate phosphoribosyltransferase n=1 Tax=Angiostrongylus cantonensis TaxID=6313 RepID=A0A158PBE4_ANGCA
MKSPIYIDLRECFGYADLMDLASDGIKYLIQETDTSFDGIVGVPYAALPYATLVSFRYKKPLIIIRKEAKTYGTKKLVEGVYDKGAKVIVIEDVVTTGGSIREVVNTLRAEGLVVENVFCILDREQGAAAKLKEDGITLYSYKEVTLLQISTEMEDLASLPVQNLARLPLHERAKEALCSLNKKIFSLMLKKNSNLCLAVDYAEADKIIQLVEKAGPFVIAIKVHADAIVDFSKDFTTRLVRLAKDHEFFIFEDRKFGDTGNTNLLQLKGALHVAEWADLVTVYATQGFESIGPAFRQVVLDPAYRLSGILLIAQLSTKGCLTSLPGYTQGGYYVYFISESNITKKKSIAVTEMGEANQDVVCGFICQARVSSHPHMLHWTPGKHIDIILCYRFYRKQQKLSTSYNKANTKLMQNNLGVNLDATSDSAGQQWRDLNEAIIRQQNDIVIVGRGVTSSASPIQELTRYREAGWTALMAKN